MHGFEKPHDERGLGLMNAAAVVREIHRVYIISRVSISSHYVYICIHVDRL